MRYTDDALRVSMPTFFAPPLTSPLDVSTKAIVRLAAAAAGGDEATLRQAASDAVRCAPPSWVEEVVLQTYLFAGFPRALNAAGAWRRAEDAAGMGRQNAEMEHVDYEDVGVWRKRGEEACAIVYGASYEQLRRNIQDLHPALDAWMIVEGYGKVLSRPGLDLPRRELCIVAACAATLQERQLHSHLHGAVNAGSPPDAITATLDAIGDVVGADADRSSRLLWARVRAKHA
jgi:4-carboxymuconolactone decarboxylase